MHIWTLEIWKKYYNPYDEIIRNGLRIRFDKMLTLRLNALVKEFCKWLRSEYYFPIRVLIYVMSLEQIKALDGEMVSATFFRPYKREQEPYIRIAVGDYPKLLKKSADDALAISLSSIVHELTHSITREFKTLDTV